MEDQGTAISPVRDTDGKEDKAGSSKTQGEEHTVESPEDTKFTLISEAKAKSSVTELDNTGSTEDYADNIDDMIREMQLRFESIGPSVAQSRCEVAKKEIEKLSSDMKNVAWASLINSLQLHKYSTPDDRKFTPSTNSRTKKKNLSTAVFCELKSKIKDLEKQSKHTAIQIAEHKREQEYLSLKVNELEDKVIRNQEKEIIKDLIDSVPTENDLKKINKILSFATEIKRRKSQIKNLNAQIKVFNHVLAKTNDRYKAKVPKVPIKTVKEQLHHQQQTTNNNKGTTNLPDFTQLPLDERNEFLKKRFLALSSGTSSDSIILVRNESLSSHKNIKPPQLQKNKSKHKKQNEINSHEPSGSTSSHSSNREAEDQNNIKND